MMKRSIPASTKRRGRPKTTGPGVQIVVRVHDPLLAALDKFIKDERRGLTRPEAIRELLAEAGHPAKDDAYVATTGSGVQMAPDMAQVGSPETYVGYSRAERFVSPGGQARERSRDYALPAQ